MRILSLGYPLPGVPLDNYSFASAPSFFDYDAIVVDSGALSQLIDEVVAGTAEHRTRSGERIVTRPAGASEVGLGDLLSQRYRETERLLANGGLVVCLPYPNVTHETFDLYGWLPAPNGVTYHEPFLKRGSGTEIVIEQDSHAFAPLISSWRVKFQYHAYFEEPCTLVIARSAGGAPVAIEVACGGGRIIFLPPTAKPLAGDQRYTFSEALQTAVRQTLRRASPSAQPAWVGGYVPAGSEGVQDGAGTLRDGLDALLWQEGRDGLEAAVRLALARLGLRVVPEDIDQPAQVHVDGQTAFLEVEGSTEAVGIEAHYRLRARLEEAMARGRTKRGVLVINGYRTKEPSQRDQQCTAPLCLAAETMRYCIVTSVQLYDVLTTGDGARADRFRTLLMTTDGMIRDE